MAKAANTGDIISAWFEDTPAYDAVAEICTKCLYDVWVEQGEIYIRAYSGTPYKYSVATIDESQVWDIEQSIDMNNLVTSVIVRYGWFEKYNRLFYKTEDATLQAIVGEVEEIIDFGYGEDVAMDNAAMAADKGAQYLARMKAPVDIVRVVGNMELARIEVADPVQITHSAIMDDPRVYEVFEKNLDMAALSVEITGLRFMGE